MNRKCVYFAEGECEEKLIAALKEQPSLLIPGKVKRFNVIQNELKTSHLVTISPGSIVVLVFDTDNEVTIHLQCNIEALKKRCSGVKIVTIAQVLNFEDEMVRCTDIDKAQELTKSPSVSEFKTAVNKMKSAEFRRTLERHKLNLSRLWVQTPPNSFQFITQSAESVKKSDESKS